MATKRSFQQDPEYDAIPAEIQEKQMKLMEDDVRQSTKKKIEAIIKSNFEQEITSKDSEIDNIDDLLHEARLTLDRLRACIITKYYATLGLEQVPNDSSCPSIHPTAKTYLGKSPKIFSGESTSAMDNSSLLVTNEASSSGIYNATSTLISSPATFNKNMDTDPWKLPNSGAVISNTSDNRSYMPRFKTKCKVVIGNVSKFIPIWRREENDQSTHKWMVYVRGDRNNPNIDSYVKKIRFLLHPSYRPNDIIEISHSPFHLIKRGWGEFPVRVQLHFHDSRNKPVDIIHQLRLDKTFTGLQTLGAETVVELQLYKVNDNTPSQDLPTFSTISHTVVSEHSVTNEDPSTPCLPQNGPLLNTSFSIPDSPVKPGIILTTEANSPAVINMQKDKVPTPQKTNPNIHRISNGNPISILRFPNNQKSVISPRIIFPGASSSSNTQQSVNVLPKTTIAPPNGISTFVKCTDSEGRVLLVPQSSLVFKPKDNTGFVRPTILAQPPRNSLLQDSMTQPNKPVPAPSAIPSYILKVVPNQQSGQNQVLLIPMPEKKQVSQGKGEGSGQKSLPMLNGAAEKVPNQREMSGKKLKPVSSLEKELNEINIDPYKTFEELLKRIAKIFPLVQEGVDRNVFPHCASTIEEFRSWNIGKQRASEWQRAGIVRSTVINILSKKSSNFIKSEDIWSRKAIMLWCRKYGFTPMMKERIALLPEPTWSGEELCSLNDACDLISTLKEEKPSETEDDEEIDIVEVETKKSIPSTSSSNNQPVLHLPYLRDAAAYIKETASAVSLELKPVETEPSTYVPAIEEMILSACMELATDLLSSSVNEGFKRMGGKICPDEITISDVYSAVKKTPKFDFLTNSCLGIPKELENT